MIRAICAALAAFVILTAPVSCQDCQLIMGNHYCSSVKAMTISDFGMPGQFNMVTNMDSKQNKCDKDGQKSFGGGVSPLEEGVSQLSWNQYL